MIDRAGNQSTSRRDRFDVPDTADPFRSRSTRPRPPGWWILASLVTAALVFSTACGSGSSDEFSEAAARGRRVSTSKGCASCHGVDGQGGVGPAWIGLADSEVTLADGTTVVADDAYLTRAIKDPGAQMVAGYAVQMPSNGLSDAEVADVIAYIRELGDTATEGAGGGPGGGGGGGGGG